ncbi:MAG TPA: DUF1207 domain-containing protein [Pirellulales bacterium]|jgi:hypothetical protein|nr:DUF1207 domain-containing protein [Pirellulales bacterium]
MDTLKFILVWRALAPACGAPVARAHALLPRFWLSQPLLAALLCLGVGRVAVAMESAAASPRPQPAGQSAAFPQSAWEVAPSLRLLAEQSWPQDVVSNRMIDAAAPASGGDPYTKNNQAAQAIATGLDSLPTPASSLVQPVRPAQYAVPLERGGPMDTRAGSDPAALANPASTINSTTSSEPLESADPDDWDWRLLPRNLVYQSYWAAPKEPRFGGVHYFNQQDQLIEEGELGARFGLLRYGTGKDAIPAGWQWDVEGAAFPRLTPYDEFDLRAVDFRIGTDVSYGIGRWRFRFGYYHLSSHVGDEYLLKNPSFDRINYKRESLLAGVSNYPTDWARLYCELGCAFSVDGEAKPLELIFGTDLGTIGSTGLQGAPFAALAGHLRQELDFGGDFVAQAGWMWRDEPLGHVFRVGFQYLTGYSTEYEFLHVYEQEYGLGIWYDF